MCVCANQRGLIEKEQEIAIPKRARRKTKRVDDEEEDRKANG